MALSDKEKKLTIITASLLAIVVLFTLWNKSGSADISDSTTKHFEEVFADLKSVEEQRIKNKLLRKKIGNMDGIFIQGVDSSKIIQAADKVAGQSGVQIKNLSPSINRRSKPMPKIELKMTLQCQYPQLVKFLGNLKKSDVLFEVSSLKVNLKDPKQPNLEVAITLTTYILNAPKSQTTNTSAIARSTP